MLLRKGHALEMPRAEHNEADGFPFHGCRRADDNTLYTPVKLKSGDIIIVTTDALAKRATSCVKNSAKKAFVRLLSSRHFEHPSEVVTEMRCRVNSQRFRGAYRRLDDMTLLSIHGALADV
jgi:hypothetical protein